MNLIRPPYRLTYLPWPNWGVTTQEIVSFARLGHDTNCWNRGFNTLRPRQNGHHFADDIFKSIFLNENVLISIKISLKFIPKGPINNIPALVQIMAWRRPGDKPLSEPMMVRLLTHICVTRPQWVKRLHIGVLPQAEMDVLPRVYIVLRNI